ncbi:purine-cytosine permease family protein [Nonomuraea spiralis]|uniref:Purine-cytosine permease family protein n=1 Tax=Nonomuraea spiralis TaxID=46182 RepID=A0ABV5IZU7_9ACTN|nr:cytosine permease [Nonomuraea spiralis]GGT19394.1 cytosine permease [Nonomuraea spiralis]
MTEAEQDTQTSSPTGERSLGVERHSIDWVPLAERHGKVSSLGAIWFVGSLNLTGFATGVVTLSMGATLLWTVVATVLGSLFGTFFMAFHSAQGPQLGLPQLVQSRPQFGYVGAAVTVWVFALVNYVGYNTSDALLSGDAMNTLFSVPNGLGYGLSAAIATVLALYGYRWIHAVNRWLTWPFVVIMALVSGAALFGGGLPAGVWTPGPFDLTTFMLVFVFVAGFQLGWAPYVSDYSRYLRPDIPVRSTFWWTYLPSAFSGIWVFVLGAVVSAAAPAGATPVAALKIAADRLVPGLGAVAIAALLVGLLSIMAINQYGGSLTMISIVDSFHPVRPTRAIRAVTIAVMLVAVGSIANVVGVEQFNWFYANVVVILTYLFIPWTAINLVDYFFVRRGQYVVREIFNARGIYGRWGWRGNLAYLIGLAAMTPFMVITGLYVGPVAAALGGVDCSLLVGLPVAGGLYLIFARGLDLAAERRMAQEEGLLTPHRKEVRP